MANNYQFIDAYGSVLTAAALDVAGALQPFVQIQGSVTTVGTAVSNQSVSGTVGASIIGLTPVGLNVSGAPVTTSNPIAIQPPASGFLPVTVVGSVISQQQGSVLVAQQTSPWVVGNSSVQVVGVQPAHSVATLQGTNPWVVVASISGGVSSVSQVGVWNVNSIIGEVYPYALTANYVSGVTSIITGTTANSVLAAPGANLRNYITNITVTNGAASGTFVDIKDSGANVLHSGYAAASGGGFATSFPVPLKQATTNASIDIVPRAQASIIGAVSGFKAA